MRAVIMVRALLVVFYRVGSETEGLDLEKRRKK